mgnify:CR=1 FL=1
MTRKRGRRLPHTTLTESAERAARALRALGLAPYPGVIDPKGGSRGGARVTIQVEPGRVRITVSGTGVQELLLYGSSSRDAILPPLAREFGQDRVSIRDPSGLWRP